MKHTLLVLASMVLVVVSQSVEECDKTTLLVGNGMCTEGPLPISPGQTLMLRCPCANVTCHDHMRRVTVTWRSQTSQLEPTCRSRDSLRKRCSPGEHAPARITLTP
ncbi:uncharacterized protein LOC119161660 isoform X1 [Rhipicephalus microplus]|uniref:uncharacterized protein LOC119161660 isoform X1 n=1 Tax=Rhipicephalus microplus TaxID=6941 RepID=UPI003F6BEF6D